MVFVRRAYYLILRLEGLQIIEFLCYNPAFRHNSRSFHGSQGYSLTKLDIEQAIPEFMAGYKAPVLGYRLHLAR